MRKGKRHLKLQTCTYYDLTISWGRGLDKHAHQSLISEVNVKVERGKNLNKERPTWKRENCSLNLKGGTLYRAYTGSTLTVYI